MRKLTDFQIIRYLKQDDGINVSIAYHSQSKQFVRIVEYVEHSHQTLVKIPEQLLMLGPQQNISRYLGCNHLDGRTYIIYKHYEFGNLYQLLKKYKQFMIKIDEQLIWTFVSQLLKAQIQLNKVDLYGSWSLSDIMLEETLLRITPEIDYVDESDICRKARVLPLFSKFIFNENTVSKLPSDIEKPSLAQLLQPKSPDRVLNRFYLQGKSEFLKDTFYPSFEKKSESFSPFFRGKSANDAHLQSSFRQMHISQLLNSQNIDEKLFNPSQIMKSPLPEKKKRSFEEETCFCLVQFINKLSPFLGQMKSFELNFLLTELNKQNLESANKIIIQKINRTTVDVLHPFNEILELRKQSPGRCATAGVTQMVKEMKNIPQLIQNYGQSSSRGFRQINAQGNKKVQENQVKKELIPTYKQYFKTIYQ